MMIPILSVLNIDMIKISSLTNFSKWYLYYRPITAENIHQLFADLSPDYSCDHMSSWRVINNKINMKFNLLNIPSANSCSQSVSSNLPFWLVMQMNTCNYNCSSCVTDCDKKTSHCAVLLFFFFFSRAWALIREKHCIAVPRNKLSLISHTTPPQGGYPIGWTLYVLSGYWMSTRTPKGHPVKNSPRRRMTKFMAMLHNCRWCEIAVYWCLPFGGLFQCH